MIHGERSVQHGNREAREIIVQEPFVLEWNRRGRPASVSVTRIRRSCKPRMNILGTIFLLAD